MMVNPANTQYILVVLMYKLGPTIIAKFILYYQMQIHLNDNNIAESVTVTYVNFVRYYRKKIIYINGQSYFIGQRAWRKY